MSPSTARPGTSARREPAGWNSPLAQPTGIVEIDTGSVGDGHLHLRSMEVSLTPNAVFVSDVERHIEVEGDTMRYTLALAGVGHPLQSHLAATLVRISHGPA